MITSFFHLCIFIIYTAKDVLNWKFFSQKKVQCGWIGYIFWFLHIIIFECFFFSKALALAVVYSNCTYLYTECSLKKMFFTWIRNGKEMKGRLFVWLICTKTCKWFPFLILSSKQSFTFAISKAKQNQKCSAQ